MKKADRQKIFDKYGGRCAYCGCGLNDKWQVDHIISKCYFFIIDPLDKNSVNRIENLNPSCMECNHYKRSLCLESVAPSHTGFRTYMSTFHLRLSKLPKKTMVVRSRKRIVYMQTIADKYGITPNNPFSGKFYFETQQNEKQ